MKLMLRDLRRMAGMFKARLPDLELGKIDDRRRRQGRRWKLSTLLKGVVVGIAGGLKGLGELEILTDNLAPGLRSMLGIPGRLADTTVRDALVRVVPYELRQAIYRMIHAARRRGALALRGLPFHVVALDGKGTSIPAWDHHYAQQQTNEKTLTAQGIVRTVTATLVSTQAKPILDAVPIPAETNEMGIFPAVFESLVRVYGSLFRLVTYDAGVTSEDNCKLVVEAGKDFLFHLKNETWKLMRQARRLLGKMAREEAMAHTEDVLSNNTSVHRHLFTCHVASPFWFGWPHVKTILRVLSEKVRDGKVIATEDRYFISSLKLTELSLDQWLLVVRSHWAVENNAHWTLDAIFQEDEHPWIEADPRGVVVFMLLRRIAYNLLALFRTVTQRSEDRRGMPWRQMLKWAYDALIASVRADVVGLRDRNEAVVFS